MEKIIVYESCEKLQMQIIIIYIKQEAAQTISAKRKNILTWRLRHISLYLPFHHHQRIQQI